MLVNKKKKRAKSINKKSLVKKENFDTFHLRPVNYQVVSYG